ncbi:MAG: alpha/beta fold hydrolase, partial [Pseudomonadota bacterium]
DQAYIYAVWLLTEGAQAVTEAAPAHPAAASLWGFGKTLFLEHPTWRGGMIDLDPAANADDLSRQVIAKTLDTAYEATVALRQGRQYRQQITPAPIPAGDPRAYRDDGVFIVTGGMGGLGLAAARRIVEKGGRHLILLSRRGVPDPDADPRLSALRALGATVEVRALDVRDTVAMRTLFSDIDRRGLPVRGVVHAAGENWFSKILDLDLDRFLATLKTKVSATQTLHDLTKDRDLDCFVVFSSVSALWGSVDLSHYAAANQFADMLCLVRAADGLPSLSIDWGPWAEVGMSAAPAEQEVLEKLGFQLMPPERALAAMDAAESAGRPLSLIADMDWERFQVFIDFAPQGSLFEQVAQATTHAPRGAPDRVQAIRDAEPDAALALIEQAVRVELKSVTLIQSADKIDPDQRFNFMGMDSLMALSFAAALETYFQIDVPNTLTYNHPTIRAVTAYLFEALRCTPPPDADPAAAAPPTPPAVSWLRHLNRAADRQVICVPFAGSGATAFSNVARALDGRVDITALQLPGREDLASDAPITSISDLVAEAVPHLAGEARPLILFGHSMGATIAIELAKALEREESGSVGGVILSGCNPIDGPATEPIHALPDAEFLAEVLSTYESAQDADQRAEALARSIDLMRADLKLFETYAPGPGKISAPITAICAMHDPLVSEAEMRGWAHHTTGRFRLNTIGGGHQYLTEDTDAFADALTAALADLGETG